MNYIELAIVAYIITYGVSYGVRNYTSWFIAKLRGLKYLQSKLGYFMDFLWVFITIGYILYKNGGV